MALKKTELLGQLPDKTTNAAKAGGPSAVTLVPPLNAAESAATNHAWSKKPASQRGGSKRQRAGTATGGNSREPERTTMKLAKLVPNPLQEKYNNRPRSAGSIASLREDLRQNGQRDPVHVMPPGNAAGLPAWAILDGHGRTEDLLAVGIDEAAVLVRWDLLNAEPTTVEKAFIQFNFNRRHDHPLDLAAKAVRLCEIKFGQPPGALRSGSEFTAMRDEVAAMTGWTGRHLLRMCRILLTPAEVQRLVRDGFLPVVDAEKIEALDVDKQRELAQRLGALADPRQAKQIVREYLAASGGRNGRPKRVTAIALRLITNLKRDLHDLDGRFDKIYGPDLVEHREFLAVAIVALKNLLTASKRKGASLTDLVKESELG